MPLKLSLDVIAMIFDLSALCEGAGALQQTALPPLPLVWCWIGPCLGLPSCGSWQEAELHEEVASVCPLCSKSHLNLKKC